MDTIGGGYILVYRRIGCRGITGVGLVVDKEQKRLVLRSFEHCTCIGRIVAERKSHHGFRKFIPSVVL